MDNESKDILLEQESDRETQASSVDIQRANWKKEAINGNFMPAVLKLERKEIHQDDIIDPITENRLIHTCLYFSYYNVTRSLVELFNADINSKNAYGHTPLHIICNQDYPDLFLFSYLIKNDLIDTDAVDKTNVSPIFYTIMAKFHLGMLALVYRKVNIRHVDGFGNNVFYMALANNNKFAVRFLLQHYDYFSLNHSYYKNKVNLSDILISCKDSALTKYILKHRHKDVNINSIISCLKEKQSFGYYNVFNYEMLNTIYAYKTRNFLIIGKILKQYRYKFYNLTFLIDLLIQSTSTWIKMLLILCYFIVMSLAYLSYEVEFVSHTKDLLSVDTFLTFMRILNVVGLGSFFIMWVLRLLSVTVENKYVLNVAEHMRDNVLGQVYEAMESNPLDIFFVDEICEICLIRKHVSTNHCNKCNQCVHDFYFHSKLLNQCFSRQNIKYYIFLLNSLAGLHIALIYFMVTSLEVEFTENILCNIFIYFMNISKTHLLAFLYLFITSILMLQTAISLIICLGTRTTYYNMFRYHKRSLGNIQRRQNVYINSPATNHMKLVEFIKNLFK
jgi:hypothetical protein